MSRKVILIATFVSAIIGFTVALCVCLVFFFYVYKPVQTSEISQPKPAATPTPTPDMPIPKLEIKSSEVNSLSIEPFLTDFYEKDSKCSRNYIEVYGKDDAYYSSGPPCRTKLTFNRDGSATKTLEIVRWDKTAKRLQVLEKSAWTGKVTNAQFNALNETVVNNNVFQNWIDGISVNVTNCNIHIVHGKGTRTLMGNVSKSTTDFWLMIDAFKNLDKEISWEKA